MSKDAFWFRHDSHARSDPKMLKLRMLTGLEGIGYFWCVIEFLREQECYQTSSENLALLEFDLRPSRTDLIDKMIEVGLLVENDGKVYSKSLLERMSEWDKKKRKRAEAGRKGGIAKAMAKQNPSIATKKSSKSVARREEKRREEKSIEEKKNYSDDSLRVAEYLLKCILKHKPNFKKPNINKWAQEIDRAIRIDRRSTRELCEVAFWATNDEDFWQANILSASKLRKQFDALQLKMGTGATGNKNEAHEQSWALVRGVICGNSKWDDLPDHEQNLFRQTGYKLRDVKTGQVRIEFFEKIFRNKMKGK